MKIGQLFIDLVVNDADYGKALKGAERDLKRFGSVASSIGKRIDSVVTKSFKVATAAITAFGAASLKSGAEFEQAITAVGAVANASAEGMGALETEARRLGASTLFTATQAANAMQALGRANLQVNEIIAASGPALMLAGGAGAEMSQATNILAATLAQFSLNASDSSRVTDVFSVALRKSLFDMSSLTEAMKFAGTVGAGFGMTLEETTAAIAQFRNLGLEGSLAGTQFRMMMARAAKPTKKSAEALAELGLEVDAINPEMNSFAEIMRAVGERGMTTSQALQIFGQRSGTAVAAIAKQFAAGTSDYDEFFDSLNNSVGENEKLYEQMTDTVMGQTKIAISALEELTLTVFDTYRGPLKELLTEIALTLQHVADVVGRNSQSMRDGLGGVFEDMSEFLRENRTRIAAWVAVSTDSFASFIRGLQSIAPFLDEITRALIFFFMVGRIHAFMSAAAVMFNALRAGLIMIGAKLGILGAEVTAATGGLNLLLGAIMAAVTGYAIFGGKVDETAKKVERLRKAEEKLQKDRDERRAAELEAAGQLETEQVTHISGLRAEIALNGKLTSTIDSRLQSLERLSKAQIAAGLASGDLFQANVNGKKVVLDAAAAEEMHTAGLIAGSAAKRAHTAAVESSELAQKRFQEELQESGARAKALQEELDALNAVAKQAPTIRKGGGLEAPKVDEAAVDKVKQAIADELAARKELESQLDAEVRKQKQLEVNADAAAKAIVIRETKKRMAAADAADADDEATEAADERAAAESNLTKVLAAAIAERNKLLEEMDAEFASAKRKEVELSEAEIHQLKIDRINDVFDAELAAARNAGQASITIEKERDAALHQLELTRVFRSKQLEREARKEIDEMLLEAEKSRSDAIVKIRMDLSAQLKALEHADVRDRILLHVVAEQEIARIRKGFMDELAVMTAGSNAEVIRLEQQKAAFLERIPEEMGQERLRAERHFNSLIAQAKKDAITDEEDVQEEELTLRQKFNRRLVALMKQGREDVGFGMATILPLRQQLHKFSLSFKSVYENHVDGLRKRMGMAADKLNINFGKKAKSVFARVGMFAGSIFSGVSSVVDSKVGQSIIRVGKGIGQTYTGVFKQVASISGFVVLKLGDGLKVIAKIGAAAIAAGKQAAAVLTGVFSKFKSITGVSTDLKGLSTSAQGKMSERADLEAQIASGDLSPEQLAEAKKTLESMPATTEEAAQLVVQEMIDGALGMVTTLVQAIPVIIQELAVQIPVVAQAFAEAIPEIINAIVENLPLIVDAMVQMVMMLVEVIITELPKIVQAIIEQIPVLIEGLAQAFSQVLPAVAGAIAMFIEALPQIINALLEQLPTIIAAVVESLGILIEALVSAIPQIFAVIIDQLPTIVEALVVGLVEVVAMLVEAAAVIIPKIISMLPDLMMALLEAVVLLIDAVVAALPRIISGLISMIAGVITAVVQAVPRIIAAIIRAVPSIIVSLIQAIPAIVEGLVKALPKLVTAIIMLYPQLIVAFVTELIPAVAAEMPEMLKALFVELPIALAEAAVGLAKGLGQAVSQALRKFVDFFRDVIKEIITLGVSKTDTFGDTPHAIDVGPGGMTARFAPGDTVIAAQNPLVALRQALDAAQNKMVGGMGSIRMSPPRADLASQNPLATAMLQAASEMQNAFAGGRGGGGDLRVTVNADGRTLDEVLYRASQRGSTPHLQRQMRRTTVAAGVHIGFDRGSYQS